jgi:hypothetical protein
LEEGGLEKGIFSVRRRLLEEALESGLFSAPDATLLGVLDLLPGEGGATVEAVTIALRDLSARPHLMEIAKLLVRMSRSVSRGEIARFSAGNNQPLAAVNEVWRTIARGLRLPSFDASDLDPTFVASWELAHLVEDLEERRRGRKDLNEAEAEMLRPLGDFLPPEFLNDTA